MNTVITKRIISLITLIIINGFILRAEAGIYPQPADTSSFMPNNSSGWSMVSAYMKKDSTGKVFLGLLLKRERVASHKAEGFIGELTNREFIPKSEKRVSFNWNEDINWELQIKPNGQCYLTQTKGDPIAPSQLSGNPYLVPIIVEFNTN